MIIRQNLKKTMHTCLITADELRFCKRPRQKLLNDDCCGQLTPTTQLNSTQLS